MIVTEKESSEDTDESEEEASMRQKRISAVLLILGGLVSAGVSNMTVGFNSFAGVLPVIPVSLVLILFFRYQFDSFSKRTIPFVLIVSFFLWFITGTFLIQL